MGDYAIGPGLREELHGKLQSLLGPRVRLRSETQEGGAFLMLMADLDPSLSIGEAIDLFDAAKSVLADQLPSRCAEPRWMLSFQVKGRILYGEVGGLTLET